MTVSPTVQARFVTIDVRGVPRPQGSMRLHTLPNGHTAARYPAAVYAWRAQVQQAVADAVSEPLDGAVELHLGFDLPRIASHYLPINSKRAERELRADAPLYPTVAPDLDKLVRCVSDACTDGGLWHDDAQVAVVRAAKRYSERPGVLIVAMEMPQAGMNGRGAP